MPLRQKVKAIMYRLTLVNTVLPYGVLAPLSGGEIPEVSPPLMTVKSDCDLMPSHLHSNRHGG